MMKALKALFKRITGINRTLPLLPPTSSEIAHIAELRKSFESFSPFHTTDPLPSKVQWTENMNELRENILSEDARKFLSWDVIQRTMFVHDAPFITPELHYLTKHVDWSNRWSSAIKESSVGSPTLSGIKSTSSGNLIHHAYHLAAYEEKTKSNVLDLELVFEFGGGYGSMCRLFFNLNFKKKYIIFDLAPFSALQTYYLKTLGLPVLSPEEFEGASTGILCTSDIAMLTRVLEKNNSSFDRSLFIATWSLSETPMSFRNQILSLIKEMKSFLFAYQENFFEVDNVKFFANWTKEMPGILWNDWKIPHLKGNCYLMGRKSS